MKNLLLLVFSLCYLPAVFASEPTLLPPTAPTITGSNIHCPGATTTTLLSATGCATGEFIDWYTSTSTPSVFTGNPFGIAPTAATSYYAKCRDGLGVSSPFSIAFLVNVPTINTPAAITASVSGAVSPGTSVILTASGCTGAGETYQWEDLSTAAVRAVSPTVLTTYTVKCKSGVCLSAAASYTVIIDIPAPVISPGSTVLCAIGTTLTHTITGCPAGYNRTWEYKTTGSYIVFYNGPLNTAVAGHAPDLLIRAKCTYGTYSSPYSNILTYLPAVSTPIITPSITGAVLPGTSVTLTASGCTGVGETYEWEDLSTAAVRAVNPSVLTTYSVKCKSGVCLSAAANYTVIMVIAAPVISSGTASLCSVGPGITMTITGCPAGYNATWEYNDTGTNIIFVSNSTPGPVFVGPAPGRLIIARCTYGTYTTANSNIISFLPAFSSPNPISSSAVGAITSGSSVTLTASGCTGIGETYQWEDLSTAAVKTVSPTGLTSYSVQCKSGTCLSIAVSYTVIIAVSPPVISSGTESLCPIGPNISLTITGCPAGYTRTWEYNDSGTYILFSNGSANSVFAGAGPGRLIRAKCTYGTAYSSGYSNIISFLPGIVGITSITKSVPSTYVYSGTSVTLTAVGSCPSGTILNWDNNTSANPRVVTVIANTTYTVRCLRISDNCYSPIISTVLVPGVPEPVTTASNAILCDGQSKTLSSTSCTGTSESLRWYTLYPLTEIPGTAGLPSITVSPTVSGTAYASRCFNSALNAYSITSNQITVYIQNTVNNYVGFQQVQPAVLYSNCGYAGTSVLWSNGATTANITVPLVFGTLYSYACTSVCGTITSPATAIFLKSPAPVLTASASSPICSGQSVTLTANSCAGPSVGWYGNGGLLGITSSNTFVVTVTGPAIQNYAIVCITEPYPSNPSNTISFNFTSPNTPGAINQIPLGIVPTGSAVTLSATGCGTNTIKWENASTLNPRTVNPISTSIYSFQCVSGSCVSTASSSITVVTNAPCPSSQILLHPADDITVVGPVNLREANSLTGSITASNHILNIGTQALYKAASVTLLPGFYTQPGIVFLAITGGCGP